MLNGRRHLALSSAAALALSAGAAAAQEELKIGMVNLSLCCAYFVGMDAAVKDEATHFANVTVLATDAGGDVAKLTDDVEDLLNQGAKALIVSGAGSRPRRPRSRPSSRQACRSSWSTAFSRGAISRVGSALTTAPSARASAATSPNASAARARSSSSVAAPPTTPLAPPAATA